MVDKAVCGEVTYGCQGGGGLCFLIVTLFLSVLRQKYAVGVFCLDSLWSQSDHVWWWRWRSVRLLTSTRRIIQTSCECPRAPANPEASSEGRAGPWLSGAAFRLSHVDPWEIMGTTSGLVSPRTRVSHFRERV